MSSNILFLAHVDESGATLPKVAYEALAAALDTASRLGATLTIGLIGETIQDAADSVASTGARILGVSGADFAHPRYASDAAAVQAICAAAQPQIVIAPATSRFLRVLPGIAHRLQARVDTHITSLEITDGALSAKRWFYKQRLEAVLQRDARPWILLLDSGCHQPWTGTPTTAQIHAIEVALPAEARRTKFAGIRIPNTDAQTIRPDAKLLFVAGAGWGKKQSDGKTHLPEAETAILEFLQTPAPPSAEANPWSTSLEKIRQSCAS